VNAGALRSSVFRDEIPNYVHADRLTYTVSPEAPRVSRVRVANPSSRWVEALKDRFDELTSLPKGWDGYAGRPVKFTCAQFAANLIERLFDPGLPPPSLVPGSDGTVQIEWHRNRYDIEIDVLAPYEVVATRFDHVSGLSQEVDLGSDFTDLAAWISDLKSNRLTETPVGAKSL
jgi:hypothetical protein